MPEELSDLAGLRGMIVLLEKQVHLQNEVGAVGIEYKYHIIYRRKDGSHWISHWAAHRGVGEERRALTGCCYE